jgi:sodium-dependent dicarboxylate transporter 2/3/5
MFISNTACTAMMVPICSSVTSQLLKSYKDSSKVDNGVASELLESATERNERIDRIKPTKRESRVAKGLLISICFAANIGGTATLTGTPPNLVLVGVLSTLFTDSDTGVHYLSWLAFALPL